MTKLNQIFGGDPSLIDAPHVCFKFSDLLLSFEIRGTEDEQKLRPNFALFDPLYKVRKEWAKFRQIICAINACFELPTCSVSKLLCFVTSVVRRRLESNIEAKFCSFDRCKIRKRWTKYLSQFYDFGP